jgi:putative transposase
MFAYITGSVDQEILLQNEYLVTENRILKSQIKGRLLLTDPERISLAEIGPRLGRKALEELAQIVRSETVRGWHRKLIAMKFDRSKSPSSVGRAPTGRAIEDLVLQFARENGSWGCRRIVGALSNRGHEISHQTVANVLKRHGLAPAPERGKKMPWKDFIRSHTEVLAAVDFFTAEVWAAGGLMTYYVVEFMRLASRQVCIAGITLCPHGDWMKQMARNITMAEDGLLNGCRYLLHDLDTKFGASFGDILWLAEIKPLAVPPRRPNLNAHLERWNRSAKEECLSKMIWFGEASLRHVLSNYAEQFHRERNHQGRRNVILFPTPADRIGEPTGEISTRERLGGLRKFYRQAA